MPTTDQMRPVRSAGWRFVLVGGLNTLVTGIALSLLSTVIDPRVAYTVVFAAGIAFSTAMAGRFVNGVPMTRRQTVLYVLMYVAVYLVGVAVLWVAAGLGMPDVASGLVVLVTAPLTFFGGRVIIAHRRGPSAIDPRRVTP
ncbi:GtrA family protein [Actinotalea ferrariae]|uniref:GtrA family protein n=1 Tax=Actinotalea ferrariae TaxID=1386098 RepID=UPI001C8BDDF4|nr:GtrA family protein [Actinotalea ferrariae]MBX9243464.1 GtrA family protein [Actinotalea ferrariae]